MMCTAMLRYPIGYTVFTSLEMMLQNAFGFSVLNSTNFGMYDSLGERSVCACFS